MDRFGEATRLLQFRVRGLAPDHVGVRCVGQAAGDRLVDTRSDPEKPFGRSLVVDDELAVALIHVDRQQPGGVRVGSGDHEGRDPEHIRGQPSRDQLIDGVRGVNKHLAAHVPALLCR